MLSGRPRGGARSGARQELMILPPVAHLWRPAARGPALAILPLLLARMGLSLVGGSGVSALQLAAGAGRPDPGQRTQTLANPIKAP